jgi:diguanylate cyclase (GGDEF)-like protein
VVGLLVAQGAPLGLLVTRFFEDEAQLIQCLPVRLRHPGSPSWLWAELTADFNAYLYLTLLSSLLFVVLGLVTGSREDRLRRLAVTDPLTGLLNRRYFADRLRHELERAKRYGTPLALLVVDLDWLKAINDGQGHHAGDRAIKAVATTLTRGLRATDVAARYAGDEFAALLPQTTAREAVGLARRIGSQVSQIGEGPGGAPLSVSIGVADLQGAGSATAEDLFMAADEALYAAKAAGRNSVVVAPQAGTTPDTPSLFDP